MPIVPFSSYLTLNNIVILKCRLGVARMTSFHRSHCNCIYVVIMAILCIVSEIKRDSSRKSRFFSHPTCIMYSTTDRI